MQLASENFYLHIFSHFQNFTSSLYLKQVSVIVKNHGLSSRITQPLLFKVVRYVHEIFENVKPHCKSHS